MLDHRQDILVLDGGFGSSIQLMDIPASAWAGFDGCNEWLSVSAGEIVESLHGEFLAAGCNMIETNTFGANEIVLAEYGLSDQVEAINTAAVDNVRNAIAASGASRSGKPIYIAGSMGPTTKLPSLGHIGVDELAAAYRRQSRALIEAGVDLLMLETCQDVLQAKLALIAAREAMALANREVPVIVSLTIETTGTMLLGADLPAAVATLSPFAPFAIGLNCATGPAGMASSIRYLAHHSPTEVLCMPNAGLPTVVDGQTRYDLSPSAFAASLCSFVVEQGVRIVGGCCGTTPAHLAALVEALQGETPAPRDVTPKPQLASAYQAVDLEQSPKPLMIGERANANGSKKFRECLLADDMEGCLQIALAQEEAGSAHALDLCVAYAGRDEQADMQTLLGKVAYASRLPVVIDSTNPDVVEKALQRYPGRAVINSIHLEDGGANLERICRLAKKYGAACIALTIGPAGMARTVDEKLALAKEIYDRAVGQFGLRPCDLIFDVLTFTVGSGDESLREAGICTLEAIARVKAALPGVLTTLGVSNISFGLSPAGRRVLNSLFLHEAIEKGLDTAIVDAAKILPLAQIDEADREAALALLYHRVTEERPDPLLAFIAHFDRAADAPEDQANSEELPPEQQLQQKVFRGDREGLDDLLAILRGRHRAEAIINDLLIPAMRLVGERFGRGETLLPFVLQSAEVIKRAVDLLEPFVKEQIQSSPSGDAPAKRPTVLLATVAGDVHDIGKNLVDILLRNNGYHVHNIGIKVSTETIIAEAQAKQVDVIGLSGLLVKSAIGMKESLPQFAAAGLRQPILLGGAALTASFVADQCVPEYPTGEVVYCRDAFSALTAMRDYEQGTLASTASPKRGHVAPAAKASKGVELASGHPVPDVPFVGRRHVMDLDPQAVFPFVNTQALFRGRWGYRRGAMSSEAYAEQIEANVQPLYRDLIRRSCEENLIQPRVAYGYFRCQAEGETLRVQDPHAASEVSFVFPRQADPPHRCIADFFYQGNDANAPEGDVVGFFVVTLGEAFARATQELYQRDEYHEYMLLHGFGVEVTDALAEYWHRQMRREMGLTPQGGAPGCRYGFGYPACPDLDAQQGVFTLLDPAAIGVTLSETMQMAPELSTSAIVAHHPQANYFAV